MPQELERVPLGCSGTREDTVRSMTGYGQATGQDGRRAVSVTLRGVNNRFLDLRIRLDEGQVASEPTLRSAFGEELFRGRVDASVEVRSLGQRQVRVTVDRPTLHAVHAALHSLAQEGLIAGELDAGDLLRLPDVFRVESEAEAWDEAGEALLLEVAGRALEQMVAARVTEGTQLDGLIGGLLDRLQVLAADLEAQRERAVEEIRASLRQRLDALLGSSTLDPLRLEQEVALLVDRSDVREELDRLVSHLEHFRELMAASGSLGKRLDFLTQEILRELNTLGSKCRHTEMIRSVLEAKTVCEQLREQVQNVE